MSEQDFKAWWDDEGSAIRPEQNDDHESHAYRVAKIAWAKGEYCGNWRAATEDMIESNQESASCIE